MRKIMLVVLLVLLSTPALAGTPCDSLTGDKLTACLNAKALKWDTAYVAAIGRHAKAVNSAYLKYGKSVYAGCKAGSLAKVQAAGAAHSAAIAKADDTLRADIASADAAHALATGQNLLNFPVDDYLAAFYGAVGVAVSGGQLNFTCAVQ